MPKSRISSSIGRFDRVAHSAIVTIANCTAKLSMNTMPRASGSVISLILLSTIDHLGRLPGCAVVYVTGNCCGQPVGSGQKFGFRCQRTDGTRQLHRDRG